MDMFSSIRQKLAGIYIMLIILPLLVINYLSVENMRQSVLREIEVNALKTANILSNVSRGHINNHLELKKSIQQYMPTVEGRILVLNQQGRVILDSFHLLEGTVIENQEIRYAFEKQERFGYYQTDKYILQAAVPILQTTEAGRTVLGAVLISVSVDEAFAAISDFRQQLMMISIAAAILGVVVAIFASQRMTEPIVALSEKAKRIGAGHLGEEVEIKSKDEIGRLAENFNHMSRELYRIDKGRTEFIGNVSHELKTPLASIKALIDSLLYGEDDIEVYREYLRDMDGEIDRLSDLVHSLLSLTKIEEQGIKTDVHSIKSILEDAVKILNPLAEKYEVEISVDLQSPPNIICDSNRIKEVFINLIDNALKYRDTEKEKRTLVVTGKREKNHYVIKLRDNGIGIKEKEIKSIFEKFYRADASRSRDTGGAGIGLSIVSRILQLHQWDIAAESKENQGTVITIYIPNNSFRLSS
ncbi:Signal transduction histidine kinase [Natronincola peptidivorans]|uniref:histidine kinase n=1 Tax=Natronincola peptidivorans TaxID=426128 RepID=A0A1H9ZQ85_9FIRM|nr:HAMP domain-containing sensor histidine kinase [Natronincola peptidivorans]SES83915.1 Signal transduction histidine kinase [Natronincola peptidivorans]